MFRPHLDFRAPVELLEVPLLVLNGEVVLGGGRHHVEGALLRVKRVV